MLIGLYILFLILTTADVITTIIILNRGGRELWKPMIFVMEKLGSFWWVVKIVYALILGICIVILLTIGWETVAHVLLLLANMLYIYIVLHNLQEIRR